LFERGVLVVPGRKIAKNREPGRCCDTGCTAPGTPQMVPLPIPATAHAKRKPARVPARKR
jgi:4-hydroxybutyryl-CoA dehydratase/vinylacetyl-CoA-Delta-isomerase